MVDSEPSLYRAIFDFNLYGIDRFVAGVGRSLPEGARVLDAGAGPCRYKKLFDHCQYEAQDFAQYEGTEHQYGELTYVSDITSIPVPDNCFDGVLCTEVLEHLARPDLAIQEFARILKPGGVLALTAPLGSGIHMAPYHFYGGFTPYWYEKFLGESGFTLERIEANGGFFKHYGQESRRFLTLVTPKNPWGRLLFLPVKALLAVWFRALVPILCYSLDGLDKDRNFTIGYFVTARKG